jgi:hypothetical protein
MNHNTDGMDCWCRPEILRLCRDRDDDPSDVAREAAIQDARRGITQTRRNPMKYINPKSLTWWSGVAMIVGGALQVVATKDFAGAFQNPLILGGLATIGVREAIRKSR